jgi:transcriptional regulator with XRE-family HTH domain
MSVSTAVEKECNRISFSQKRHSYGITLDDISKKSGLAMSTISAYERFNGKYTETRTRDDNAIIIERTLDDIIKERLAETFSRAVEKEEKPMEESVKTITANNINKELDRKKIAEKIKKYCFDSGISLNEFYKMCGINNSIFSPSTIKRHPYLYDRTIYKICSATGWTREQLVKSDESPSPAPTPKVEAKPVVKEPKIALYENDETRSLNNLSHDGTVQVKDKKFTFQDGKYYMEYTVVRKVKQCITKEQFMARIEKEEQ